MTPTPIHPYYSVNMDTTDYFESYRQLSALDQQKNQLIQVPILPSARLGEANVICL